MKKLISLLIGLVMVQAAMAVSVEVLNTDPAPLKAGEFADVTLQLSSDVNDGDLSNVQINIDETEYIRVIGGEEATFANFVSGRTATRTFRLFIEESLPEGFVNLHITVDSDKSTFEFDESIFIEGGDTLPELAIGKIRSTPSELLADTDDNQIRITLQNLGDKDAELVKAELRSGSSVSPSYSFSMEDSVGSIKSGEEAELEFVVDLDEDAQGEVPSTLELRYRTKVSESYETFITRIPFDLELIDAPMLEIVKIDQLSEFVGGTAENKVLVTIKNDGAEDAEEVRVRVVPDISYPFIFETTTQYVSSKIKPGEMATVSFTAEVMDKAEDKEYDITTKLESLVGEARYTREDVMTLKTTPGKNVGSSTVATVVLVIVFAFALFIGYRTLRRRRK